MNEFMTSNRDPLKWNFNSTRITAFAILASVIGLIGAATQAIAQPTAKGTSKKDVPAAKGTVTAKASTARSGEPATPEQAAKVLDLRTFPVLKDAKVSDIRTLAMLMYEAKSSPKAAFEFQRVELTKRGFKEQPGGYADEMTVTGHFIKDGFHVGVSASANMGEPDKKGVSSVSLTNDGNVDAGQLPVPKGVKPFFPQPYQGSYTTDAKVAAMAAECRKLLLAAGWEPYGQVEPIPNQPDSSTQYFKRNAIRLQAWISTTPVDGGKTMIRYMTELLQADLPAPPDIARFDYTDFQKVLRFDAPLDQTEAIIAFYQKRLPKQGWTATTEKPVVDDRTKSQFVIFRNEQKDLLSLDLAQFTDIVRVSLKHQTAAEVAEEERRAKAAAEKKKAEEKSATPKSKSDTSKEKSEIPSIPDLPPGVDLPDDVKELLKKVKPEAKKKPAPAKPADPKNE